MGHVSYMDTVARMAKENWGREFASKGDATKEMAGKPEQMAAYGILEIIRRIDGAFDAAVDDRVSKKLADERRVHEWGNEKRFPQAKVGDVLYSGDCEDGLQTYRVIGVDDGGRCLVIGEGFDLKYATTASLAWDGLHASPAEAFRHGAESDVSYHTPRLKRAHDILAAIESGDDLTPYMDGIQID